MTRLPGLGGNESWELPRSPIPLPLMAPSVSPSTASSFLDLEIQELLPACDVSIADRPIAMVIIRAIIADAGQPDFGATKESNARINGVIHRVVMEHFRANGSPNPEVAAALAMDRLHRPVLKALRMLATGRRNAADAFAAARQTDVAAAARAAAANAHGSFRVVFNEVVDAEVRRLTEAWTAADPKVRDSQAWVEEMAVTVRPNIRAALTRPGILIPTDAEGINNLVDKGVADVRARLRAMKRAPRPDGYAIEQPSSRSDSLLGDFFRAKTFTLGKVQESALHRLRGELTDLDSRARAPELWFDTISAAQSLLVRHDWAGAFSRSEEFAAGEYRLPYERCCFEFLVNGRRVVLAVRRLEDEPRAVVMMAIQLADLWMIMSGRWEERDDGLQYAGKLSSPASEQAVAIMSLVRKLHLQVRAVCISLEAEVAVTEVVRAPHRLNSVRERKGQPPILDYHVVSLVARKRHPARLRAEGEEPGTRKRLHWVRGHWRHYASHKTWLKWHLRGSPDLGFIDKHYLL